MFKPAKQVKRGDIVYYEGENLTVTISHPHLATPDKHILEFEDSGDFDQLLGVVVRSTTEIHVVGTKSKVNV